MRSATRDKHSTFRGSKAVLPLAAALLALWTGVTVADEQGSHDAGDATGSAEARVLDAMRGADAVTYAQTGIAALAASGRLELSGGTMGAYRERVTEFFDLRGAAPQETLSASEFAYLLMEAFPIPQGLMYRLAPSPRYAIRELRYRDLLPGEWEATERIDGRTALSVISRTRAWIERREPSDE
jgi:hypothetical protein